MLNKKNKSIGFFFNFKEESQKMPSRMLLILSFLISSYLSASSRQILDAKKLKMGTVKTNWYKTNHYGEPIYTKCMGSYYTLFYNANEVLRVKSHLRSVVIRIINSAKIQSGWIEFKNDVYKIDEVEDLRYLVIMQAPQESAKIRAEKEFNFKIEKEKRELALKERKLAQELEFKQKEFQLKVEQEKFRQDQEREEERQQKIKEDGACYHPQNVQLKKLKTFCGKFYLLRVNLDHEAIELDKRLYQFIYSKRETALQTGRWLAIHWDNLNDYLHIYDDEKREQSKLEDVVFVSNPIELAQVVGESTEKMQ